MFAHHHGLRKNMLARGFTVIELMVTITIVVLVTGLIMIQYSSFNSSVLLRSQAYLTAFDVREAQSLAVSVRGNGDKFHEEYGLYFDMDNPNPNQYILFQDSGNAVPAKYSANEAIGTPYIVDPRFKIVALCAEENCNLQERNISLSFKRPNFDAKFANSLIDISDNPYIQIKFSPINDSNIVRTVKVYQTGQIDVE